MEWVAKARDHAVVLWLGSMLVATLAGAGAHRSLITYSNDIVPHGTLEARVAEELEDWKFTAELYRSLPNDVSFIARGLQISLVDGTQLAVVGPSEGQSLELTLSKIVDVSQKRFVAGIRIASQGPDEPIVVNHQFQVDVEVRQVSGPLVVGVWDYFISIDNIDLGGSAELSIARRRSAVPGALSGSTLMRGNRGSTTAFARRLPVPRPILE